MNASKALPTGHITESCPRCGGSGHYSFCPGRGTVCFKCNGTGTVSVSLASIENKLKRDRAIIRQRNRNGGYTNAEVSRNNKLASKLEAERCINNGLTHAEVAEMIQFSIEWHKNQAKRISQWIGNQDQTITCYVTLTYVRWCATLFGQSLLWIAKDPAGNKVKGFSSGKAGVLLSDRFSEGKLKVVITGVVKALEEYQGEKSTMLTRIKIMEDESNG